MLETRTAYRNYDTTATSYLFGRLRGAIQVDKGAALVSASTTVNAVVSGVGTFSPVKAGDYLWFYAGETLVKRKVASVVSPDQITIDSNPGVTANTGAYHVSPFDIGATATDGWIPVQKFAGKVSVLLSVVSLGDAGGIDVKIQVKGFDLENAPIDIIEKHYDQASAPFTEEFPLPAIAAAVRIGLKGTAGFGGTDDISVSVSGNPSL